MFFYVYESKVLLVVLVVVLFSVRVICKVVESVFIVVLRE